MANKKIVAISGSIRTGSSNHAVLRHLERLAPGNIDFMYCNISLLPHFDAGLDNDTPPDAVAEFRSLLAEGDGIIICSPEYAFGVPGSLKNALDWTVGSGSLAGKPMALITASTGGEHAHTALQLILEKALCANLPAEATLLISFIKTKMDSNGNITDDDTAVRLKTALTTLLKAIR